MCTISAGLGVACAGNRIIFIVAVSAVTTKGPCDPGESVALKRFFALRERPAQFGWSQVGLMADVFTVTLLDASSHKMAWVVGVSSF
jgi:hypothetical protein